MPSGVRPALGTSRENCPSGDGTTWKPANSVIVSVEAGIWEQLLVVCGPDAAGSRAALCPGAPGCGPHTFTVWIWLTQEARWLRRRVLASEFTPSYDDRKRVTSPTHSLNPALYLLRTDGSECTAAAGQQTREFKKSMIIRQVSAPQSSAFLHKNIQKFCPKYNCKTKTKLGEGWEGIK